MIMSGNVGQTSTIYTANGGTIEGGRFDFNDGGSYVGEWSEGRAHGLGIATGPEDNPGEFAGEWILGFENLGVYVWPNGGFYEGRWTKGKRHGEGVQQQGRWKYKGEFTTGFCGRYGVRECLSSQAKYEGSWNLNQFDGFGIETSCDGSTYAGGWTKGFRSGLGVRKSATYSQAADFRKMPHIRAVASRTSINDAPLDTPLHGDSDLGPIRRPDEHKNGFVLVGRCPYLGNSPSHQHHHHDHHKKGFLERSSSLFHMNFFRKLRREKSTGDLHSNHVQASHRSSHYHGGHIAGGSLRSTYSTASQMMNHSVPQRSPATVGPSATSSSSHRPQLRPMKRLSPTPFSSSPSTSPEVTVNANTIETYSGQWLDDRRTGYGVAERTDGLRYEGEWFGNRKNGYGCTTLPDGSKEEGRYRNNILVTALNRKNKLSLLRQSRLRDCVDAAVAKSQVMAKDALTKSQESANQRAQTARMAATSAEKAAKDARRACELARAIAHEFAPDFVQPGHIWERNRDAKGGGKGIIPLNTKFSGANQEANTQTYHHLSSTLRNTRQQQNQPAAGPGQSALNPTSTKDASLEVSGGSRRGSFRSSFRRNKRDLSNSGDTANQEQPIRAKKAKNGLQSAAPLSSDANSPEAPLLSSQQHSSILRRRQEKRSQSNSSRNNAASSESSAEKKDKFDEYGNPLPSGFKSTWRNAASSKRDSGLGRDSSQEEQPNNSSSSVGGNSGLRPQLHSQLRKQHESSDTPDSGMSDISQLSNKDARPRRRTLPAVMTTQPVPPVNISTHQTGASTGVAVPFAGRVHLPKVTSTSFDKRPPFTALDLLEQEEEAKYIYIIENGIRKRVKQESWSGSEPRSTQDNDQQQSQPLEGDELAPLPTRYCIEEQEKLCKDLGEGSLPDLSVCRDLQRQGVMSREEVSRMSQAQRHRRLLEEERRRRGQIVIRVADVKPPPCPIPGAAELQCTLTECSHCLRLKRERRTHRKLLQRQTGVIQEEMLLWPHVVSTSSAISSSHSTNSQQSLPFSSLPWEEGEDPPTPIAPEQPSFTLSSYRSVPLQRPSIFMTKQEAVDLDENSIASSSSSSTVPMLDWYDDLISGVRSRNAQDQAITSLTQLPSEPPSERPPSLLRMASVIAQETAAYQLRETADNLRKTVITRLNLWDWMKKNKGLMLLVLVNVILAIGFLYLLQDYEYLPTQQVKKHRPR